jgi:hypothetical protein
MQTFIADGPELPGYTFEVIELFLAKTKVVMLTPGLFLGGLLLGTLNFNRRRTEACIRHGYRVATRTLKAYGTGAAKPPRIYRLNFSLITRLRLIRRALPSCSVFRLFARGDANREALRDFNIPRGIRPPRGEENSSAWVWSVVMIWLLFMTDAFSREHSRSRAIWGTIAGFIMIGFPTWWARVKRNVGIPGQACFLWPD